MVEVQTERVLVIPTDVFHRLGYFQGFSASVDDYLDELFSPEHMSYRPREAVEEDPSFKQLIPYCIFRYRDPSGASSVFQYTRGKGQGEQRLHARRSIGVGGHISATDAQGKRELHPYEEGLRRELEEEVRVESPFRQQCVGLINDDKTAVGRVHLGVVHLLEMERPAVQPRESDILDAGFSPVTSIFDQLERFETWSQICARALFDKARYDSQA